MPGQKSRVLSWSCALEAELKSEKQLFFFFWFLSLANAWSGHGSRYYSVKLGRCSNPGSKKLDLLEDLCLSCCSSGSAK